MASEIKVDTISEKTSAGGVTIDGLLIKDGGISGDVSLIGTTPTFTIGDAGAEDAALVFDGNAQDYYIALDDSADDLVIGLGSTVGTTPAVSIDENLQVIVHDNLSLLSDSSVLKFGTDGDTTLTHTDGTGLTLNSTNKLCFNDASQYIQGASNAILDIAATDEIELTATLVDLNGNLDVSGTTLLPTLGVITAKDLGAGIHIRTADSGASVSTDFDELVIENSSSCGISILAGTGEDSGIDFGDSGGSQRGRFIYAHNGDNMMFHTAGAEVFRLTSDGQLTTRGETAPDVNNGGICLNQGGDDGSIITLKSSDVAHGMTSNAETDTFLFVNKETGAEGGVSMTGVTEGDCGFRARAFITTGITDKATDAEGPVDLRAMKKSGSGLGNMDSNENLLVVKSNAVCRFIFDSDGDFHADSSSTTYDAYEDAQLARAFDLSKGKGVINSKFDKFVAYNHEKLADLQLVGREKDGTPNHFMNVTGFQRLHNGAIWQQYEKHNQLLEAVYDLAKEAVGEEKANAILDKHEVKRLQ